MSLNNRILRLALPAIVNNITVPLLGLCDTTIAGHLGSPSYIGAMALGAMMLNVIYWLCGFLRAGTTGMTAQAFGAEHYDLTRDVLRKALTIALAIAFVAICCISPLRRLLFLILDPALEVAPLASQYFEICLWAAPAQLAIMAISGWFIGLQNTLVPMLIAVGINVINIALSISFVWGFDLGFAGVAYGTLTANWIGLVAAVAFVAARLRRLPDRECGRRVAWGRFFKVNTDLFFRSACIMAVSLIMTSIGSRIGDITLATNAVMMQFFLFFSYFMDGFAFAGEAIVGKAAGAHDFIAIRRGVNALMAWGAAMAALFLLIYILLPDIIVAFITDVNEVRLAVADMHIWLALLPPITVSAFIFDGVFIGLAKSRDLLVTTLIATLAFVAIAFIPGGIHSIPSNSLLWLAFETYLLLRGILLAACFMKFQRFSLTL
ncbi:MAG: MATE family efflux transporter [Lepagella sp.]